MDDWVQSNGRKEQVNPHFVFGSSMDRELGHSVGVIFARSRRGLIYIHSSRLESVLVVLDGSICGKL